MRASFTALLFAASFACIAGQVAGQVTLAPAIPIPPPPGAEEDPNGSGSTAPGEDATNDRSIDPIEDPVVLEQIATASIRAGDLSRGESALRKLLSIQPGNREAVIALGTVLLKTNPRGAAGELRTYTYAFPGDARVQTIYAQALTAQGRTCEAIGLLENLHCRNACAEDVGLALGSAYLKCERPFDARDVLICGSDSGIAAAQNRLLALGSASASLGVQSDARCYFRQVQQSAATIDIARQARRLEEQLDRSLCCPSRFYGSLRISERYDDFPGVIPTSNVFGGPVQRTNSFGNVAAAKLNYDLVRVDDFTLTTGYDGLYSHYYEQSSSRYDLLNHAGYLAGTKRGFTYWGDMPYSTTLRGDYDNVSADEVPFLQRYGANWDLTVRDSDYTTASVQARYTQFDFLNPQTTFPTAPIVLPLPLLLPAPLFATPGDADSEDYSLGIVRSAQSCDRVMTYQAGYFFDRNVADSSQFTYTGHRIFGDVSARMPGDGSMGVNVSYYRRDYDASSGAFRGDDELTVGVRYLQPLWRKDWLLVAQYAYDVNQSTLAVNSYDRNVFELGLQWNFGCGH